MGRHGVANAVFVFWSIFAVATGTALTVFRGPHIEKRAVNKCISAGGEQLSCKTQVANWTEEERIDYIRDK